MLAAAIHANSPRCDQTLVTVNCAALSERALRVSCLTRACSLPRRSDAPHRYLDHANQGTLFCIKLAM
jgi:DNA-binding NtrC family response regulator